MPDLIFFKCANLVSAKELGMKFVIYCTFSLISKLSGLEVSRSIKPAYATFIPTFYRSRETRMNPKFASNLTSNKPYLCTLPCSSSISLFTAS